MIFNTPTELLGDFHRCHLRSVQSACGCRQLPGRPVEICGDMCHGLLEPTEGWRLDQNGSSPAKQHELTRCPWGRTSCYFHPNWAFCFCTRVTELNSLQLHTTSWPVYFPHVLSFAGQQAQIQNSSGVRRGDFFFSFFEFSSYCVNISSFW